RAFVIVDAHVIARALQGATHEGKTYGEAGLFLLPVQPVIEGPDDSLQITIVFYEFIFFIIFEKRNIRFLPFGIRRSVKQDLPPFVQGMRNHHPMMSVTSYFRLFRNFSTY